jgi:hypothetical protein
LPLCSSVSTMSTGMTTFWKRRPCPHTRSFKSYGVQNGRAARSIRWVSIPESSLDSKDARKSGMRRSTNRGLSSDSIHITQGPRTEANRRNNGINSRPSTCTQRELEAIQNLARKETLLIRRLQWILMLVSMCFASAVGTCTFVMLSREQKENFEDAVSILRDEFGESIYSLSSDVVCIVGKVRALRVYH